MAMWVKMLGVCMFLSDLKIIDELLCDLKQHLNLRWEDLESYNNICNYSMNRLRIAWKNREIERITMGLAEYFRNEK